MSVIEITRTHTMGVDAAKQKADELAVGLSDRFNMDYHWQQDVLKFHRPGVKGQLDVDEHKVHIKLDLGFMVTPFKSHIEREIHNHLDDMDGFN